MREYNGHTKKTSAQKEPTWRKWLQKSKMRPLIFIIKSLQNEAQMEVWNLTRKTSSLDRSTPLFTLLFLSPKDHKENNNCQLPTKKKKLFTKKLKVWRSKINGTRSLKYNHETTILLLSKGCTTADQSARMPSHKLIHGVNSMMKNFSDKKYNVLGNFNLPQQGNNRNVGQGRVNQTKKDMQV